MEEQVWVFFLFRAYFYSHVFIIDTPRTFLWSLFVICSQIYLLIYWYRSIISVTDHFSFMVLWSISYKSFNFFCMCLRSSSSYHLHSLGLMASSGFWIVFTFCSSGTLARFIGFMIWVCIQNWIRELDQIQSMAISEHLLGQSWTFRWSL